MTLSYSAALATDSGAEVSAARWNTPSEPRTAGRIASRLAMSARMHSAPGAAIPTGHLASTTVTSWPRSIR